MSQRLIFVIGATNAGKSHFFDRIKELNKPMIGFVEVGKMMRAKYPPEHFQGQAAPKHTETEAWQMMLDGIAMNSDKEFIFIDGQPRSLKQCAGVLELKTKKIFLHMYASREVREARAKKRDGHDPARLELSLKRMQGDMIELYDILSVIALRQNLLVLPVDSGSASFSPVDMLHEILIMAATSGR